MGKWCQMTPPRSRQLLLAQADDGRGLSGRFVKQRNYPVDDGLKSSGFETASLGYEKALMSREKFGGTGVTDDAQGAVFEILIGELHGTRIGVTAAGHLAQNPIPKACISQNHRRAELGL
jgi:hypothetical protein